MIRIGIDLGGTKTEAIALDAAGSELTRRRIATSLPDRVFYDIFRTRIVRHTHGDSSGVRGAAWLWPAQP